jgi:ABC-type transport system substrate-binding protein
MKRTTTWFALLLALVLVAAACGGSDDSSDTDTDDTTAATTTTAAPAESTTTTTQAPDPGFEGKILDAGGCDYGGSINTLTAIDEFTVEFNLCKPNPAFEAQIAFGVFGIQPEEHLEATGGAPLDNPIGTGPYSLDTWNRGESVVLARNDAYYGTKSAHSQAIFTWATESAGRLVEVQSGTAAGMTFPSREDLPTVEGDDSLSLLPKIEPNIFYMGFTNIFPPFDDVNVRKAVALAMDRQRIVDTFYPDNSETASHFTPCSVTNGCQGESWYDQDVEAAKALLADAGLADGFKTKIFYRDVTRGYLPTPGDVAADIQAQLKETLNIDAEIVLMESADFIQQCSTAGQCDGIHLLGWTGDYPHVTNFLDFHFAETNPQFGAVPESIYGPLAIAATTASVDDAAPLYEQANNAIKEDVTMIPVAHGGAAYVAAANVNGAYAPPWGHVQLNLWDNGEDTLVFVQNNEPISLYCSDETDGESLNPCGQIVEALYSYTPDGAVQPQLATECIGNETLDVWTCSLRQGVTFHDGSTFDANDVVVSYTAGLDAASPLHVGNTGTFEYYSYLWGTINAPAEDG